MGVVWDRGANFAGGNFAQIQSRIGNLKMNLFFRFGLDGAGCSVCEYGGRSSWGLPGKTLGGSFGFSFVIDEKIIM